MVRKPTSDKYRSAERIVSRLQEAGHDALLAGGYVRDLLMGQEPKDYDVATSAAPDEVARLFPHTKPVGTEFGVTLVIEHGEAFEVATFRTESGYADGRHPDTVAFSSLEEDAQRRDFTINGMYWNPASDEVVDTVGGRQDIEARLVRAIGDPAERFGEDHLRILRAIRFAARLGFDIEQQTYLALKQCAHLAERLVPERLQQELRIILTDRDPALALRMMDEVGVLTRVLPELEDARGCEQPENYHPEGDVFVHTLLTVEKLGPHPDFELAMAALLHDVGKPEASRRSEPKRFPEHCQIGARLTRDISRRLRLPNAETIRICWLVERHMYFKDAHNMRDSTLKRLFAEPGFDQLAEIHRADALASWGNLESYEYVMARRRGMAPEEVAPPALINGHDLIAMGYQPGPTFGEVLSQVRDAQLDGEVATPDEARGLARRLAERLGVGRGGA
jgi:tRNA nucleotidyltransferase/poly(A) polymerase